MARALTLFDDRGASRRYKRRQRDIDARLRAERAPKDVWGDTLCFANDETTAERQARLARHAVVLERLGVSL